MPHDSGRNPPLPNARAQPASWGDAVLSHADGLARCPWAGVDPLYVAYHDEEWGRPERDSRALFEKLVLDGFQAGLSWITILRKREAFRAAFEGFDPAAVARFDDRRVHDLMLNDGIVRNRAKIEGAVLSARAWLAIEAAQGFSSYIWDFVDGSPIVNYPKRISDVPTQTPLSQRLSKDLKARGFKFCGPTIVYAFMQAVGMVNDHLVDCHVRAESPRARKRRA
ncbi:DNA-3-methyladenine glycosylase I [Methylocystis sp. WRRC1]|uniref:DNA-3-methyladenine glycosylase I n=1 Tax=Methylocystis sp. WRRC1 TaxID=1732014 RepID=UPI00351D766A